MLIVPLSHERTTLRKLPWVTLGVAALCIALQIRATVVEGRIAAEIAQLERQELELGEQELEASDGIDASGEGAPTAIEALKQRQQQLLQSSPAYRLGYRPKVDGFWHMLTYAFAHGGWMHLIGNLLFLYLTGCNMEDRWGRARFAALYLGGALVSAFAFRLWHPAGETPLVGASGAIAAVMGTFAICFASTKIRFFYFYWFLFKPRWGTFEAAAWVALPIWFLQQAVMSLFEASRGMDVAYSAHVGGFVFGVAVAAVLRLTGTEARILIEQDHPDQPAAPDMVDPDAVDVSGLMSIRQKYEALEKLERALEQHKDHEQAREKALKLAFEVRDAKKVRTHAALLFARWARAGQPERVASRYRAIREQWSELELGEAALKTVINTSSAASVEPIVIVDATSQLIRQHPESALLPRAMLAAADAQTRLQRTDLASRTLQNIVEAFPMDPFAEQARMRLRRSFGPPAIAPQ